MELLCENDYGSFCVEVDGRKVLFTGKGCKFPVRMYVFGEMCEYAGLAIGDESWCVLEYVCKTDPIKISLLNGRIDDEHQIICEFELTEPQNATNIFGCSSLCDCIRYYGHYLAFFDDNAVIYAFPSDFYTHPLPELLKYAYWYEVNFGLGVSGYYFIGLSSDEKPFFVDKNFFDKYCKNHLLQYVFQ